MLLTCQRVDLVLLCTSLVHIRHKAGKAADAVATHLRLTAIGVEDAHREVCVSRGGQGKDHLGGGRTGDPRFVDEKKQPLGCCACGHQ